MECILAIANRTEHIWLWKGYIFIPIENITFLFFDPSAVALVVLLSALFDLFYKRIKS